MQTIENCNDPDLLTLFWQEVNHAREMAIIIL